jgi:hypothetical protein
LKNGGPKRPAAIPMTIRDDARMRSPENEPACRIEPTRPLSPSRRARRLAAIHAALDAETALRERPGIPGLDFYRASLAKWRLARRWLRDDPYRDRAAAPRSTQWREALGRLRPARDPELIEWLVLQAEVARNLERGIQDMRPRKGGPTWLVVCEYLANRERKAIALLRWAEAAAAEGCFTVDSDWHARTRAILGGEPAEFGPGAGGHEGLPWPDREES